MYAILETLIDALRLMTFQPPGARNTAAFHALHEAHAEAAAATDHPVAPRPLIHADPMPTSIRSRHHEGECTGHA